jgi:hypothetical protein
MDDGARRRRVASKLDPFDRPSTRGRGGTLGSADLPGSLQRRSESPIFYFYRPSARLGAPFDRAQRLSRNTLLSRPGRCEPFSNPLGARVSVDHPPIPERCVAGLCRNAAGGRRARKASLSAPASAWPALLGPRRGPRHPDDARPLRQVRQHALRAEFVSGRSRIFGPGAPPTPSLSAGSGNGGDVYEPTWSSGTPAAGQQRSRSLASS